MPIYATARFQVRGEALAACQTAITDFVAYVREHEPHSLLYVSMQDRDDPTQFLHCFIFTALPECPSAS